MNLKIEFARKVALAYTAVCRPLCQEMKLPQTAFDILMFLYNNPEYKTARDIVEIRNIKANLVSVNVEKLVQEYHVVPVTDPDFELLAVNRAEGFRAGAQFYALPPLEVGAYTGFVQPIEPHPIRQLTIELEINRHHGNEERAADAAGKAALRQQVAREIWAQRCAQAEQRARKELVWQLGDAVKGPLPKQLVGGNYFAEQRQFNLSLQANGINFDQFLKVRGQTVEEFRAWLHAQAERKLRSWLGLLLVAEKEGLAPTDAEVEAAAAHWDVKLDGERTFPANDARKVRQRLARERAEQFIVEHSTLTPPPDEPIVQKVESK